MINITVGIVRNFFRQKGYNLQKLNKHKTVNSKQSLGYRVLNEMYKSTVVLGLKSFIINENVE